PFPTSPPPLSLTHCHPPSMPSPSSKLHTCLVCSSPTKHAHLGILLCRACKIFYGRAQARKRPRVCRAGTNNCSHKCKHCRFVHITRLLQGNLKAKEEKNDAPSQKYFDPLPSTSLQNSPDYSAPFSPLNDQNVPQFGRLLCSPNFNGGNSFINRIRFSYCTIGVSRRATELTSLHPHLHPILTLNGTFPLIPATLSTTNVTSRSLVTALFDFCTAAFEEFSSLSLQQKWFLLKNFKYSFFSLESAYRVFKDFSSAPPMVFMSLTTFITQDTTGDFAGPMAEAIRSDSKKYISLYLSTDVHKCRDAISRLNPSEEEFLALLVLCCWNLENSEAEPELMAIGEKYKRRIMNELEEIYRRKGMTEFATRLGEILAITTFLQMTAEGMPLKLEVLRLHNIIEDDTFLYSVNRT
ncbi:hypothetical protein PMAYCL1PPCAC_15320, partial [Pristionchus mayeri]